jgi:hypothetical protein
MIKYLLKNRKIRLLHNINPFINFIFFQNPENFNITSFIVEGINPNHKFIIYGKLKHNSSGNYTKICKLER